MFPVSDVLEQSIKMLKQAELQMVSDQQQRACLCDAVSRAFFSIPSPAEVQLRNFHIIPLPVTLSPLGRSGHLLCPLLCQNKSETIKKIGETPWADGQPVLNFDFGLHRNTSHSFILVIDKNKNNSIIHVGEKYFMLRISFL